MGIAEKRWHGYDNGFLFLLVHFFREGVYREKKRGNRKKKWSLSARRVPRSGHKSDRTHQEEGAVGCLKMSGIGVGSN